MPSSNVPTVIRRYACNQDDSAEGRRKIIMHFDIRTQPKKDECGIHTSISFESSRIRQRCQGDLAVHTGCLIHGMMYSESVGIITRIGSFIEKRSGNNRWVGLHGVTTVVFSERREISVSSERFWVSSKEAPDQKECESHIPE